jgi:carotenoid cleavage dioxygenase-like enzyme
MSSSTTATGKPVAIQPRAPGFTAGFASLDAEIDTGALPVTGTIPDWLRGALLRNGPALFDSGRTGICSRPGAAGLRPPGHVPYMRRLHR